MKKKLKIALVVVIVLLLGFSIRFRLNNSFIKDFNKQNYTEWKLKLLNSFNIYQPYVAIKNYGDYYYKTGEYDKALEKYDLALTKNMSKKKACDTRINACLTVLKKVNVNNKKEAKALLNKAKQYIEVDDCASLSESDSSKRDSEKLSEEIDKQLSSMGDAGDPSDDPSDDPSSDDPIDQSDPKVQEVQKSNNQAQQSRDKSEGRYTDSYEPYKGKNW